MNDTIIDRIYDIVMADLAGTDIQGGTDMTEAEKHEVYIQFRYIINKARCISDYFKQYIDNDNAENTDEVV